MFRMFKTSQSATYRCCGETIMIDAKFIADNFIRVTQESNKNELFIIVDLCQISYPLLVPIQKWNTPLDYALLFDETSEMPIKEEGPLLLSLQINNESHMDLLFKICEQTYMDNRLIGLNADKPFSKLTQHLRNALQVKWGEKEGVLRYYSPDLFEAIYSTLTKIQKQWFNQGILRWFFVNNFGEWVDVRPPQKESDLSDLAIKGFTFTEEQYDSVIVWADVHVFRHDLGSDIDAEKYGGEKNLLNQLYVLSLEADSNGISDNEKRARYYFTNLKEVIN